MKKHMLRLIALAILIGLAFFKVNAVNVSSVKGRTIEIKVSNYYKYRFDHSPGREIFLLYKGNLDLAKKKVVEVTTSNGVERTLIPDNQKDSISILLPAGIGVGKSDTVMVALLIGKDRYLQRAIIPQMRYWNVYIYPHSHVDIGYTNTQANVEFIHKRNLDVAMELAEKTKNYPDGARFKWNPEVIWPIERYLRTSPQDKCEKLLSAIRKGDINVDASYVNTNTSACNDEELYHLYQCSKDIEKLTNKPVKTIVQVDIAGVSWGVVPVANQMGIPYFMSLYNGPDRTGLSHMLDFKPFWWIGPDGKSKILFLQPGSYAPGAKIKGKYFYPSMKGQTDRSKLLRVVKTDNPRKNFVDVYLDKKLPELENASDYPYDIFPMSWCMADNTPVDADLPDAVKSWNEEYAYPKLRICNATEIMEAFAQRYGDRIPTRSGDYTEYWTDGLGSAAKYVGQAREVKERLIQAETLSSILHFRSVPLQQYSDSLNESWRNTIMGTEHTWAYTNPKIKSINDEILRVKYGYFDKARLMTDSLMNLLTTSIEKKESNVVAVFNTESWERTGIVYLPSIQSKLYNSVFDEKGKEIVSQRLTTGDLCFLASDVPALGLRKYYLSAKRSNIKNSFVNGTELNNGVVKIKIDPRLGDIVNCIYKGTEFVDNKASLSVNSFRYILGGQLTGEATGPYNVKLKIKENGPLISSIIATSDAEGCNKLSREMALTVGSPSVEITDIVDKIGIERKESIHFGFAFNILEPVTHVNIPWGVMELEKQQLEGSNRNWIQFERWLDISNKERGVTWCSLNTGTVENGDMTGNIIGSAINSPEWYDKIKPSSIIYSFALNNHWHTNFPLSQEGKITYKYCFYPHLSSFDASTANKYGIESMRSLFCVPVDSNFNIYNKLLISPNKKIGVSIYKTINNGKSSIIRLFSLSDKVEKVKVSWADKQPSLFYCRESYEEGNEKVINNYVDVPSYGSVTLRADW